MKILNRTWAEVDLGRLAGNYRAIARYAGDKTAVMGIIKADAYGHGAVETARALIREGIKYIAVSNLDEAAQLRSHDIKIPILVLTPTHPAYTEELCRLDLTQTVPSLTAADEYNEYARRCGERLKIHIKVDTGMSRLGVPCAGGNGVENAAREVIDIYKQDFLETEGIFTHFAQSESDGGDEWTRFQFARFNALLSILQGCNINISYKHCSNSGAAVRFPEMGLDFIRPGLILYGMYPDAGMEKTLPLRPVMSLKAHLLQVKEIRAGEPVSYGCDFTAPHDMKIGVVPVGYADGYLRAFAGRASILVGSKRAPVIGRICMDMCMVDLEGIDAREHDIVTIFGGDDENRVTVEELADIAGTINYELACLVGKRIPRVYLKNGKECGRLNYITSEG